MQVEVRQTMDRLFDPQSRMEMICAAMEFGVPTYLNLEWVLDAVEREEWGGIWW